MSEWVLIALLSFSALIACLLLVYPLKNKKLLSIISVPVSLLLVLVAYYYWGGFAPWQNFQHQQRMQAQARQMLGTIKTPDELIDKLKAKLDDSPKSAKGWYLLGRLYSAKNNNKEAVLAFKKAYRFSPDNEQYAVNYAHGLWQLNNQQFNEQILGLFKKLLNSNPNQPDALAMLAMNAYMSLDYEAAIDYWQRLLKLAPAQSKEAIALHKSISKAQNLINKKRNENND